MMKEQMQKFLTEKIKQVELWAFLENHGGGIGFHSGYLQALRDIKQEVEKLNVEEQLTLF